MANIQPEKRNSCTFLWRIENFSFCWQKKGEWLQSPVFVSDVGEEIQWLLRLYPRGRLNGHSVGFYLHRGVDNSSTDKIEIVYELSVLSEDQTVYKSVPYAKTTFEKNNIFGWGNFIKREDLFSKERSIITKQDALTVRCQIRSTDGKDVENAQFFARTVIKIEKVTFTWNIKEFSRLEVDQKVPFSIKSASKQVVATLNLFHTGQCYKETICIEITFADSSVKFFTIQSCILDENAVAVQGTWQEHCFHEVLTAGKYTLLTTKRRLTENKSLYLPKDTLSLRFKCIVSTGIAYEEIERVDWGSNSPTENRNDQNKLPELSFTLNNDLKTVFDEGLLSDMKLCTATDSFPVHKVILSARSPVFKSMFCTDMREKKDESVNITDVDSQTLRRLLLYIYTDTLEDLEVETATKLYEVADKYSILNLKGRCSSFLKDMLEVSNACDVLVVADMHHDEDLKLTVQDYILEHECVFHSEDWKHLMENNSKLTSETMLRKILKV